MKRTIHEIAERAQVAKSTVSKALNGHKGVSEKKRQEIRALAEEFNYEPSAAARSLTSNKTGTIGLLLPHTAEYSLSAAYWSAMISAISGAAGERGYTLMILTPREGDTVASVVDSVIRKRNTDGLIIGAEHLEDSAVSRLRAEEIPFVCIGKSPGNEDYCVDVDNAAGSERLVERFVQTGKKRIACLAGPEDLPYTMDRVSGFKRALAKHGVDSGGLQYSPYSRNGVALALEKLISGSAHLDALFITAGGDFLLDAIDALKRLKVDLSALSLGAFDDYRFIDYLGFNVTTVRQPLRDIGRCAAGLLFDLIDGKTPESQIHVLDVEIVLR